MTTLEWALLGLAASLVVYAVLVLALVRAGRRSDAVALAAFVPDLLILFRRLLMDERVAGWHRASVVGLVAYLATPIDLVPDFIPIAGQLDDALAVALVLRVVLRGSGPELLREHWPGPEASLAVVLRLAYGSPPKLTETAKSADLR